ncbi:MAG: dodecin domain-containing protein [Gemmatimonadota bacterium]|nr:dodecin domain-containing protein [Gemmatimonadota bacterium]
MAEPFQSRTPGSGEEGLLSKVTGRRARADTVRALETVLADAERICDVSGDRIAAVGDRHGIDLAAQLRTARRNLYRRFLEHCLDDYMLSDLEVEDLSHLKEVLHLSDPDVAHIQNRVSRDVYGAALETVLEDHRVDDEEKVFLKRLRADLDLSEFHASQMFEEGLRRAQQRTLDGTAIDSAFLAPGEEVVELEGSSRVGLGEAVQAVIDQASVSLPGLAWADVSEIRVRILDGRISQWRVRLRAGVGDPSEGQEQSGG